MKNYFQLFLFFQISFSTFSYSQNQNEITENLAEVWCDMLEKELDSVDVFPDLIIAVSKTDHLFFKSIIGDQLDGLAKSIVNNDKEQDDPYNFAVNLLVDAQEKKCSIFDLYWNSKELVIPSIPEIADSTCQCIIEETKNLKVNQVQGFLPYTETCLKEILNTPAVQKLMRRDIDSPTDIEAFGKNLPGFLFSHCEPMRQAFLSDRINDINGSFYSSFRNRGFQVVEKIYKASKSGDLASDSTKHYFINEQVYEQSMKEVRKIPELGGIGYGTDFKYITQSDSYIVLCSYYDSGLGKVVGGLKFTFEGDQFGKIQEVSYLTREIINDPEEIERSFKNIPPPPPLPPQEVPPFKIGN
jgi:hypothetical protein